MVHGYMTLSQIVFFLRNSFTFHLRLRVFYRDLGCGARRTRVDTTAQKWVPTELRGGCSGRSKSRNLANNHGELFRPARAKEAPSCQEVGIDFQHSNCFIFHRCCLLLFLEHRGSPQRLGRHERCAVCMWACVFVCVSYSCRNQEDWYTLSFYYYATAVFLLRTTCLSRFHFDRCCKL